MTKPYLLGPFATQDEQLMLESIGRKLGMRWDGYAVEELRRHSGGYPFLSRTLASTVAKALPVGEDFRQVHAQDVANTVSDWRFDQAEHLQFLVSSLNTSYPVEAELFRLLIEAPEEFDRQKTSRVSALRHLVQMGLISRADRGFTPNQAIRDLIIGV